MPPIFFSHSMSCFAGMLSFTYRRTITTSEKMKSGPMKLWRFFEITVSHEKPV